LPLSLTRVHCTLPAARCLEFMPDGSSLVVVTHEGVVHLVHVDPVNPQLLKTLEPAPGYATILLRQSYVNCSLLIFMFQNAHLNLI